MKRLITSPDSAEVGRLKNMLQKAAIPCIGQSEPLARTIPSAPHRKPNRNPNNVANTTLIDIDWPLNDPFGVIPGCGRHRDGLCS